MIPLANILTIAGIVIQTVVIFWTVRSVFYSKQKYKNQEKNEWFSTDVQQKRERLEQIPVVIALVIASILQIGALFL